MITQGRKLWRILRYEGRAGLLARLIHPKRGSASGQTPRVRVPLSVSGGSEAEAAKAYEALRRLGVALGDGGTRLHLAPDPTVQYGADDALILNGPEIRRFTTAAQNAAAVLVPDGAAYDALRAAGVDGGRLFIGDAGPASFARWLIAAGALSPANLETAIFPAFAELAPGARLCLSLPEATARRAGFQRRNSDFTMFDGIRLSPGWQGAGWSYATLSRAAVQAGAAPLLVCEDDMIPLRDFEARLAQIGAYLSQTEWDVFSGLLSDVRPDARITRVERRGDLTFVHLDHCMGAVCNLYNTRALRHLSEWSPKGGNIHNMTIDVWLARMPGLRVVTTLPFIAGHDEKATSTVFGFSNRRYNSLIRASEKRLAQMVARFEQGA